MTDQLRPYYEKLTPIFPSCPPHLDLTNKNHLQQVEELAQMLLHIDPTPRILSALERDLLTHEKGKIPLMAHVAVKLARSKTYVTALQENLKISVVFAVYKEHNRIKNKKEHEHGENFLIRKTSQMRWLFDEHKNITWELVVVDDGCPMQSGKIASEIVERNNIGDRVRVLFLDEAIRQGLTVAEPMKSTSDSQKGGSIAYGMWDAARRSDAQNHIILYTDADLSTHLGQIGLLVDGIVNQGKDVAIGSRREPTSVVVKEGTRNSRGKLFIYLWKRMIPNLNHIVDTQCGFKAFRVDVVRNIVTGLTEKKFAFDIELLLKAELNRKNATAKVPVAWIDSVAASTTTDLQPYLPMLKAIAKMYREYLQPESSAGEFCEFIESLDEDSWRKLLENIPAEIADRQPDEFATFDEIRVNDLQQILKIRSKSFTPGN